jgi:hypothetical protein
MRPCRAPGQRAENSRIIPNPICTPNAGWLPAAPEGQNASPDGPWPGILSIESSEEPGFLPCSGRFLARMKFSSQGMLTAEREPTENMTISLTDSFQGTQGTGLVDVAEVMLPALHLSRAFQNVPEQTLVLHTPLEV